MPTGAVKVKADIVLNYGRANQQHQTLVIELEAGEDAKLYTLGEVTFYSGQNPVNK